ncbi:helix-turn-helix domain-containing protein [Nonomuraea angiospora]|uniref:MerR family transcriptional regulator n=1 Tax=Nonomuraea angiospora TaxID=46172 RepID=UPI0033D19641
MTKSPARLLKPREVARLFDVEISTVVEWARTGKIPAIRTPGGQQYRFNPDVVIALMEPIHITDKNGNDFEIFEQPEGPEAS